MRAPSAWKRGDHVLARGERWKVVDETRFADCAALRLAGSGPHNAGRHRTLLTPFDRPRPLTRRSSWRVVRPRRWLHDVRRAALEAHPHGGLRAAAEARIDLLPYQLEPALAIWRHGITRVLIADDVGLGKTIQAGLILRECAARSDGARALVLTPAGLRNQWSRELETLFDLRCTRADAAWLRACARELPADVNPWELPGIFLASFDFVKRPDVLRPLEDVAWDLLVADEVHGATLATDRHTALHAVAVRARRVVLLTATPHSGDPAQFESICRTGAPVGAPPIAMFRRSRADVSGAAPRRTSMLAVVPSEAERRMHRLLERYTTAICREADARGDRRARLAAIVLRKRALSSAGALATSARRRMDLLAGIAAAAEQLPLPMFDEDPLPDAPPDLALAAPGLADAARERRWLGAIAQAAQTAASAETKAAFLIRLLRRVREPAIVFTEYRDTLARIHAALARAGRAALLLHGAMTPGERTDVQQRFNAAPSLLLATDAASEGLNLHTHCRVVVHYELPWSLARLQQRTGRVDRIGQRRRVHELLLVADDTAERVVLAPLLRRAAQARACDTTSDASAALTESRVAAAVLGIDRADLTNECTKTAAPTCAVRVGFGREAEAESARLRTRRTWTARSAGGHPDTSTESGPLVTALRRARGGTARILACTLLYSLRLVARDGSLVHAELVPIEFDVAAREHGRRTALALRATASTIVDRYDPIARRLLNARFDRPVTDVVARHAAAVAALLRREETIASAPAAAQQIVQPGLFDGRALREAASRHRSFSALLEATGERMSALRAQERVTASIEIVALLLRSGRPRP